HGLDARHARLLPPRARPPPLPPPRTDLRDALRLHRELRLAAEPRRGGARKGFTAPENAGGPVATAGQPPDALRLDVGPPGQEAPVHGGRDGPGPGVGARPQPRLAPARAPEPRRGR